MIWIYHTGSKTLPGKLLLDTRNIALIFGSNLIIERFFRITRRLYLSTPLQHPRHYKAAECPKCARTPSCNNVSWIMHAQVAPAHSYYYGDEDRDGHYKKSCTELF